MPVMPVMPAMALATTMMMMMMMAIAKTFNCCFCQMNGKRPAATTATAEQQQQQQKPRHTTQIAVCSLRQWVRVRARILLDQAESGVRPLETSGSQSHNVIYICLLSRSPAHLCCTAKPGRPLLLPAPPPPATPPLGDKATLSVDLRLCGQRGRVHKQSGALHCVCQLYIFSTN